MPIPAPNEYETRQRFIERCMGDEVMVVEFPDAQQRYAVCLMQLEGDDDGQQGKQ